MLDLKELKIQPRKTDKPLYSVHILHFLAFTGPHTGPSTLMSTILDELRGNRMCGRFKALEIKASKAAVKERCRNCVFLALGKNSVLYLHCTLEVRMVIR